MATKCFSVVRGKRVRVTRLDECGVPMDHLCGFVVTKGFISVSFSAEIEDGDEVLLKNANGEICILDSTCPSFKHYSIEVEFCNVDPDLFSMMSGVEVVADYAGNSVGFQVGEKMACTDGYALELWSGIPDTERCRRRYGYFLLPWIVNGVLGDFTIENDATTFTLTGRSKKGNGWGQGPYDVVATDDIGGIGPLLVPLPPEKHLHTQLTTVAPPATTCGCQPLGNPEDYVAPAAPLNLTAGGADSVVNLDWSTSPEQQVTGYEVYRSTSSDGSGAILVGSPTVSHYSDTTAVNGQTYYYYVIAVDSIGQSDPSNIASATPMPPLPSAPANLTAASGPAVGEITLNWSDSPEADVTGYQIWRSTSPNVDTSGPAYATSAVSGLIDDSNLTTGTTYYYKVRAVGMSGVGAESNEANATPRAPLPAAPIGLVATPGDDVVVLDWDDNSELDLVGYEVFRSTSPDVDSTGTPYATTTSSAYTDNVVDNGTTYYYVVIAVGSAGDSAESNEASATPMPPVPAAPAGLTASPGNESITLAWPDSPEADVTGYEVFRSTSPSVDTSGVPLATPTTSDYVDTAVVNGTTYYYVVRAVGMSGTSPASNEVSATPETNSPPTTAPTLVATAGDDVVTLDWDDNPDPDLTGYEVFRSTTANVDTTGIPLATVVGSDYVDNVVDNGTTYYYVVRAVNPAGVGPVSNEEAVTPVPPKPAAISDLTAVGETEQISLDWSASTTPEVTHYEVWRDTGLEVTLVDDMIATVNAPATEYVDTAVVVGTRYYYKVRPLRPFRAGDLSNQVDAVATSADTAPAAPLNLTAVAGNSNVNLDWDDSPETDVTGYEVFRSTTPTVDTLGTPLATVTGRTSSAYSDATAVNGTTYYYVVRAVDAANFSAASNEVSATPVDAPPSAPTNLVATAGDTQVALQWDDNPEADVIGYEVFRSETSPVDTTPSA